MTNIISVTSYKANRINTLTRIVYLVFGLGIATMISAYPPIKTEWIVTGSLLGIILTIFAIIGLWPRLKVSLLGHVFNNRVVHTVVYFLVGMGVIMMTYLDPPVAEMWYVFFSFTGALMVFDAIISSAVMLSSNPGRKTNTSELALHNRH